MATQTTPPQYAGVNTYWLNELDQDAEWDSRDAVYASMNRTANGKFSGPTSISLFVPEDEKSKALWSYFGGPKGSDDGLTVTPTEALLVTTGEYQDNLSGDTFPARAEVRLWKEGGASYVAYKIYALEEIGIEALIQQMPKRLVTVRQVTIKA